LRSRLRTTAGGIAFLAVLAAVAACRTATTTQYFHPNADIAALRTVAVLPFESLAQDRTSADKVQKIFMTELLALDIFDVVEPGAVVKALREQRIEAIEALGPEDLKKLGEGLKADALFLGTVVDFADNRSGGTPAPEVTIQLRLVESLSGVTVWTASRTRSGASTTARLFGIGGGSLTEAARELIQEELKTLLQ